MMRDHVLVLLITAGCASTSRDGTIADAGTDALEPQPRQDETVACEECGAPSAAESPRCVAGVYRGHLEGTYRSEPGGVCGLTPGPEAPVSSDVVFELRRDGNGEFFSVQGGCMVFDLQSETSRDMRAELIGSVDCATGELRAEVRGTYEAVGWCDFGQVWTHYFFEGTWTGSFAPESQSFVATRAELRERPSAFGELTGGSGTWTAELSPDASAPSARDCLGMGFPEDLAPRVVAPAP